MTNTTLQQIVPGDRVTTNQGSTYLIATEADAQRRFGSYVLGKDIYGLNDNGLSWLGWNFNHEPKCEFQISSVRRNPEVPYRPGDTVVTRQGLKLTLQTLESVLQEKPDLKEWIKKPLVTITGNEWQDWHSDGRVYATGESDYDIVGFAIEPVKVVKAAEPAPVKPDVLNLKPGDTFKDSRGKFWVVLPTADLNNYASKSYSDRQKAYAFCPETREASGVWPDLNLPGVDHKCTVVEITKAKCNKQNLAHGLNVTLKDGRRVLAQAVDSGFVYAEGYTVHKLTPADLA